MQEIIPWSPGLPCHVPPEVRVAQLEKHTFTHLAWSLQERLWLKSKAPRSMGQEGISRIWKDFMLFMFQTAGRAS